VKAIHLPVLALLCLALLSGCGESRLAGSDPGPTAATASKGDAAASSTVSNVQVSLGPGWNGVGFQSQVLTALSANALISGQATFNGVGYVTGSFDLATLNAGAGPRRGFWVFAQQATSFTYSGVTDGSNHVDLTFPGYQMVSFCSATDVPGSTLVARQNGNVVPLGSVVLPQFFEIGQQGQPYTTVDVANGGVLKPGRAYWVFANVASGPVRLTFNSSGPTPSPPAADYGEAPDAGAPTNYPAPFAQAGNFPTLFANNGARALNVTGAVIGAATSAEVNANDPLDPDGAPNFAQANGVPECDAIKSLFTILQSVPPPTRMGFPVSLPTGSTGGTYYVNVLIDLDMDGNWGGVAANGEREWAVRNQAVVLAPGQSINVTTPFFAMTNGNLIPAGAWGRLSLTSEQVAGTDWDGTGAFTLGEIEDFVVPNGFGAGCPRTLQVSFDRNPPIYSNAGANGTTFVTNVHPAIPSGAAYLIDYIRVFGTVVVNGGVGIPGQSGPGGGPCTPPAGTPRAFANNWNSTAGSLSQWRVALSNVTARVVTRDALAQAVFVAGQTRQEISEPNATAYFVGTPHGLIEGSVDSSTGEPLLNASVSADISIPGTSGVGGFYSILAEAGSRALTVEASGHKPFQTEVMVIGNQVTRVNVVLEKL